MRKRLEYTVEKTKGNINKQKDILCPLAGKLSFIKMLVLPKLSYRCKCTTWFWSSFGRRSKWEQPGKFFKKNNNKKESHLILNNTVWTVWIHFIRGVFQYSTCIFLRQIFKLSVGRKLCARLEMAISGIKRTGVWILSLSKPFQLPAFGWVICQSLCFWGRKSRTWSFDFGKSQCL